MQLTNQVLFSSLQTNEINENVIQCTSFKNSATPSNSTQQLRSISEATKLFRKTFKLQKHRKVKNSGKHSAEIQSDPQQTVNKCS